MSSLNSDEGVSTLLHANGWQHAEHRGPLALSQSAVFYLLAFGVRFVNCEEAHILRGTYAVNFANTAL